MKKKPWTLLLALCMAVVLLPVSAFAAELLSVGGAGVSAAPANDGVELLEEEHTGHPICGDANCTEETHSAPLGDWTEWTASSGETLSSGSYYLTGDVTDVNTSIQITGTVNLCLNGHTISGEATNGILRIGQGGTLNLCDCKGNGTLSESGSHNPVFIHSGGVFNLYSGTVTSRITAVVIDEDPITNNDNSAGGTVNIYGGTVESTGGSSQAIKINEDLTDTAVLISGGTVKGAKSVNFASGTVEISGTPTISGPIHLDASCSVTLSSVLQTNFSVTFEDNNPTEGRVVAVGTDLYSPTSADASRISVAGWNLKLNESNQIVLTKTHTHPVCGDTSCTENHNSVEYQAWDDDWNSAGATLSTGSYYLTKDVTLEDGYITISGDVNLCLNGHTIQRAGRVFYLNTPGSSLTICDCSDEQDGKVENTGTNDAAIYTNSGDVTLYGGTVTGQRSNQNGASTGYGTVTVNSDSGSFTMYGGKVENIGTGGVTYAVISRGPTTVYGGTISSNGYGIYVANIEEFNYVGSLTLSGSPSISGNSADLRLSTQSSTAAADAKVDATGYTGTTVLTVSEANAADGVGGYAIKVSEANQDKFSLIYSNNSYVYLYHDNALLLHQHVYSYTANNATITETCTTNNCGHSATATISLNSSISLVYTGSAITPAQVSYSEGWAGGTLNINYSNNTDVTTEENPATASITVDGVMAKVTFQIAAKAITGDVTINFTGDLVYSQTLTASYTGSETVSYQWQRSNEEGEGFTNISGATGSTYTLTADDIGHTIRVVVSGTGNYTGSREVTTTTTVQQAGQTAPTTDDYTIDYSAETITFDDDFEISTSESGGTTITSGDSLSDYWGKSVYIRRPGSDTHSPSGWTEIKLPKRPDAPGDDVKVTGETIQGKGDGTVTIPAGMEYSTDGGQSWTTTNSQVKLENQAGNAQIIVRVAATATAPHGAESAYTVAASDETLSVTFIENGGSDVDNATGLSYNATITKPETTRIGYTFAGWYNGDDKFNFNTPITGNITLTAHWTLNAPPVTVSANPENATATYSGGDTVIILTANPSHDASGVTYTYQWYKDGNKVSGATEKTLELSTVAHSGSYYVVVIASDGRLTSNGTTSDTVAVTIHKADPVTTWPTASAITYGQTLNDSTLNGGVAVPGTFTWQNGTTAPEVSDSEKTPYIVVFTPTDTANYNTAEKDITLTVNKKTLTPSVDTVADKTYDGTTAATGTIKLEGAVNSEQPTATGNFAFAGANAGEDKTVNVTGIALAGTWGDNYQLSGTALSNVPTTADIVKRTVTLTWSGYTDLTYDGQQKDVTATAGNLVSGDTCTVTVENGTQTNAGTYTATATGLDNSNYALPTDVTQEYTIAKKPVTVSVDEKTLSYTYSNTAYTADVTVTGGVEADGTIFTVSYRADDYKEDSATSAGSYDVWVELTNANYKFAGQNDDVRELDTDKDLVIAPKPITGTWTDLRQVYGDGKTVGLLLNGLAAGDEKLTATITWTDGKPADTPTPAGTYALTATVNGNYTLTNGTATLVIERQPVYFTVSNNAVTPGGAPTITTDPEDIEGTYTVTYRDEDGNVISTGTPPTMPGEYEIWVEFDADSNYQAPGGLEQQIGTVTVTPRLPTLYQVSFDGSGAEMATEALEAAGGSQITLPAAPAREGYRFIGWSDGGSVLYQPGDRYAVPYRDVTLTAQWQAVFTATVNVTEEVAGGEPVALSNAVVELWYGSQLLEQVTTGTDGTCQFTNLVPGTYNLVMSKDVRTVTSKVVIVSADTVSDATLPAYATNSVVTVAPGSPAVVVGNLDTAFEAPDGTVYTETDKQLVEEEKGRVELTFIAQEKQEAEVATDLETIREVFSTGTEDVLIMDYQLKKTVFEPDKEPETTKIAQSNVLLEVILPLPGQLQGKYAYRVYRMHEDQAQQLAQTPNELGEYFTVDAGGTTLTLHVRCFSTYAVGYEDAPVVPPNPSYQVQIPVVDNGTVTSRPSAARPGEAVTLTVMPDADYAVDTVTVTDYSGAEVEVVRSANGTYTFVMPNSQVTVSVTFVMTEEEPLVFTDVDVDDYFYDAVYWAVKNNITVGASATTFDPEGNCTRAQMVTFLWRAAGCPEPTTTANPFTDVSADGYYYEAVLWAVENDIAVGTSDTTFEPGGLCTRAQMVTFLWRAADEPDAGTSNPFEDVDAGGYYYEAVLWAVENGITVGVSSTAFEPAGTCTRAQAVTFLYRDRA